MFFYNGGMPVNKETIQPFNQLQDHKCIISEPWSFIYILQQIFQDTPQKVITIINLVIKLGFVCFLF